MQNLRLLISAEEVSPPGTVSFDAPDTPYRRSTQLLRKAWMENSARRIERARAFAKLAFQANPDAGGAQAVLTQFTAELNRTGPAPELNRT